MPTRYLKSGIRDSERIDQLSPLAEVFFYRLLVTVDDFGRYDARPAMLKAACFPIKEEVTSSVCESLLVELVRAGLARVYKADTKTCLQIEKWDSAPRSKESKYAEMTDDCPQLYAGADQPDTDDAQMCATVRGIPLKPKPKPKPKPERDDGASSPTDDAFARFWSAYPRKVGKPDAIKAFGRLRMEDGLLAAIQDGLERAQQSRQWREDNGAFIPHPATWLNRRGWEDEYPHATAPPATSFVDEQRAMFAELGVAL